MPEEVSSRLRWSALCLMCLLCLAGAAGAVSMESIPSPRPHGWTVDLTGTLTPPDIQALNELCEEVHRGTGAEMAVVVVGSVDGADPRRFATRLFNHWGIGPQGADSGLLLFVALDDRAAEIVLGRGIDSPESRRLSGEIMEREMLPLFRVGRVADALRRGADASARRILGAPAVAEAPEEVPAEGLASAPPAYAKPAPSSDPAGYERPAAGVVERFGARFGPGAVLAALGLILGGVPLYFKLVPPRCRECRTRMLRLEELEDDLHLEPGERAEERVGSVNYDIWLCSGCARMEKRRWARIFTIYSSCPKCGARTRGRDSTVLVAATYSHGGQVRVDETCVHCDYRHSYTYSTPRKRRTSSSSSRSGSGFGGGRSSGGGASGRW